jgi:hypothetical protein
MKSIKVLLVGETKGSATCPGDVNCDDVLSVQSLLFESSYKVTLARSFQDAYDKVRVENFELFLVDHEPGRGFSACPFLEFISRDERLSQVPAIGTSTFGGLVLTERENKRELLAPVPLKENWFEKTLSHMVVSYQGLRL